MSSTKLLVLSVVVIVASNVLYHVSQKSIPSGVHPLLSVAVTYAAALEEAYFLGFRLNRGVRADELAERYGPEAARERWRPRRRA